MPELPEVENVRQQMSSVAGCRILSAELSPHALRYSFSPSDAQSLAGARIGAEGPQRLGRYILLPLGAGGILMIHLGMTGSIRIGPRHPQRAHDHAWICLQAADGSTQTIIYNDPRRFGGVALLACSTLDQARQSLGLGIEPTAPIPPELLAKTYSSGKAIKPMLMDNALVTGIGNIYASEICHEAQIAPTRAGRSLSLDDFQALGRAMHRVIQSAIAQGGSTLRNYVHVDGSSGSAQQLHRVYARAGEPCARCAAPIIASSQAGRATFHCGRCQS